MITDLLIGFVVLFTTFELGLNQYINGGGTSSILDVNSLDSANSVVGTRGKGAQPSFSNLPAETTISNNEDLGTTLITLSVSDDDLNDVLTTRMTTNTTQFSFDPATLILTVGTLTTINEEVELVFEVNDVCEHTTTGTFTVTISDDHRSKRATNDPPVFYNSPSYVTISEDVLTEQALFNISVNDTGTVFITCAFAASIPSSYPFEVRLIPTTTTWGIFSKGTPGFNHTVQSLYTLLVDCTDTVNTAQGTYVVNLTQNATPNITNLQATAIITTSTMIGAPIFNVTSSDAESDNLDYTMTCTPTPCSTIFQIFDSGQILLNTDLTGHTVSEYALSVSVSDGRNTDGPKTLNVTITGINNPVSVSNLPLGSALLVDENTALASSVYQVSFSDVDASQTHTWVMTSSPPLGLSYFSIDTNGLITTSGSSLNYEALTVTSYTLSVTVSDPETSDTQTLTVNITDINEAPMFAQSSYGLTATEGLTGASLGTPSFGLTDPDTSDSYTLTMDCGSSSLYFQIDSVTGEVTLQSDYDIDTGSLSSEVTCSVNATDNAGLTDTANLTITISNINDNTPAFVPDTYSFFVSYYADLASAVGTVTASDADAGLFGSLTYTIDQSSIGAQQFYVDNNGGIYVQLAPDSSSSGVNYTETHTVTVTVTDGGGLSDNATVTITISDTTTTTMTTTTTEYVKFFEDPNTLGWFVPCMILLLLAMACSVWVAFTCKGHQGCEAVCARMLKRNPKHRGKSFLPTQEPSKPIPDPIPEPNSEANPPETVRNPPPPKQNQGWRKMRMMYVLKSYRVKK